MREPQVPLYPFPVFQDMGGRIADMETNIEGGEQSGAHAPVSAEKSVGHGLLWKDCLKAMVFMS
jgi:hypothetical protein